MTALLHELLLASTDRTPASLAIKHCSAEVSYEALANLVARFAGALTAHGLARQERVAVYLPKRPETVVAIFGSTLAGGVFVPINPLLKPQQVGHILRDCAVRVLVSTAQRLNELAAELARCPELRLLVVLDGDTEAVGRNRLARGWDAFLASPAVAPHRIIDVDMAAILYTSGSTGNPKGVVLSHRNMVTGAESVAKYLENRPEDRLLAALPFSFDYGFSQLSTAFAVGASVVLMEYLFPRDIVALIARERVTGLAGVPPLWSQLAELSWPSASVQDLRYMTNSGGALPSATLQKLRRSMPKTQFFLMYGLTEAFRSTYLPPSEIDRRPGSMGKAIPNAEILVLRPDGSRCAPGEPGELVHRGSLVALGYWNDLEKTAERFRPMQGSPDGLMLPEIAVWSGDTVRSDEDGYLYFIGRRDEMIKTSGYRVSPTEIEEIVFASGLVADAVAVGVPHPTLGQAIVLVAAPATGREATDGAVLDVCRRDLPAFMVPAHVAWRQSLPRNPNGKYDRAGLAAEFKGLFVGDAGSS